MVKGQIININAREGVERIESCAVDIDSWMDSILVVNYRQSACTR